MEVGIDSFLLALASLSRFFLSFFFLGSFLLGLFLFFWSFLFFLCRRFFFLFLVSRSFNFFLFLNLWRGLLHRLAQESAPCFFKMRRIFLWSEASLQYSRKSRIVLFLVLL